MSVAVIVAPILAASWPAISTAACTAAASFGYNLVKGDKGEKKQVKTESIEMEIENSAIFKETLRDQKKLIFTKDKTELTFYADTRGKCSMRVCGEGKTKEQLQQIGRDMMNKVTQQYVYNKVVSELKQKGYSIATEEINENKTVCVRVRRFV